MFEVPSLQSLAESIGAALPSVWLASSVMILLLLDIFLPEERKDWTPRAALLFIGISFVLTLLQLIPPDSWLVTQLSWLLTPLNLVSTENSAFFGMYAADGFTDFLNLVTLGTAAFAVLLSTDYLKKANINHGEFYSLLLLSTAGVMFMVGANNLLLIFVALELLSIPLYIMAAFRATDAQYISQQSALLAKGNVDPQIVKSEESGIKYFILGAFASAFLVYGAALIYGATGHFQLDEIGAAVPTVLQNGTASFLLLAGTAFTLAGLGFKVAAVPFHMWTPDVYEGAPTPVTAFMSVAAKIGGFAALMRLMIVALAYFNVGGTPAASWIITLQVVAAATLILGNLIAVVQTNVKRLLAYSSIAHAGYILIAVLAVGAAPAMANQSDFLSGAAQAMAVYLLAYLFTNIGAFAVVQALEKPDGSGTNIDDFAGLFKTKPLFAVAMTIFMLSLAGIPLTGGFFGKWLVFASAVQGNFILIAVIGVLTSVISAFYYLRIVVKMFLDLDAPGSEAPGASRAVAFTIYAAMAGVLFTGIALPFVVSMVQGISF
jgi:NADH-quinone oxidoreductase subunit N